MTNSFNMAILPEEIDPRYVLNGGSAHNAIHLITGKEAHVSVPTSIDNVIRIDNKYQRGQLSEQFLLDKLQNNIVLLGYKAPNAKESHIVSLYGIDKDNFYVIDSNVDELDPHKTIKPKAIPKSKLFNELEHVTFTDLSTNLTPEKTSPIKAKIEATKEVRAQIPDWYFKQ